MENKHSGKYICAPLFVVIRYSFVERAEPTFFIRGHSLGASGTRGAHARYSLYVRRPVAHTLLVPDALIFLQEGDHQLLLLLAQLEVLLVLLVFVFARLPSPTAVQVCDTCETRLSTDQNVSVSEYDCTSESREGMMM